MRCSVFSATMAHRRIRYYRLYLVLEIRTVVQGKLISS